MTLIHFGYTTLEHGESLRRQYVRLSRAWYGPANLRSADEIDNITVGHYSSMGGSSGEFSITLDMIGVNVRVWDDAWHLFRYESEFFDKLSTLGTAPTLENVEHVLQECGFIDATPASEPRR